VDCLSVAVLKERHRDGVCSNSDEITNWGIRKAVILCLFEEPAAVCCDVVTSHAAAEQMYVARQRCVVTQRVNLICFVCRMR
jgi:hypothetical protein